MTKLSILIPTITEREEQYDSLYSELIMQIGNNIDIEICPLKDNREMSIGEKRNKLLEMAKGEYVAFVDDDDAVSENYIALLLQAVESGCDCASLKGVYYVDGVKDGVFEHSLKYDKWETVDGEIKYLRFPNHLNCIKSSIAKQFKFPEKNFSEDFDWSTELHKSGLLKTEHYIDEVIYYYRFIQNK